MGITESSLMQRYLAEFVGTFVLVFGGTGAVIANEISGGQLTHTGVSLAFGLSVLACIYALGEVSGAHLNPAVSFGFWVSKRMSGREVLPYAISQCAGAIAASATLLYLTNGVPLICKLGSTTRWHKITNIQAFVMELVLSLVLMFVILCVSTGAKEKGLMAGVAVGSVVALEALFGGPFTGASMNPARSLGPALFSLDWSEFRSQWVYLLGPVTGAGLAVPLYCYIYKGMCCPGVDAEIQQDSKSNNSSEDAAKAVECKPNNCG